MDIRVLKYFLAIAQEENVTKAAELLHTTQPNISRQIAELEEELGKQLFVKNGRRFVLTEEGVFLRKRAKEIVELTERTEADIAAYDRLASGVVHIGAAETYAMRLLADAMIELKKNYPSVSFDIFSGSTAEVTEQLGKGLLDFGVLVAPVDLTNYDYIRFPRNDVFGVLMRADSPLAERGSIRPEDISDKPVIVARQQLDGNVLAGWLGADAESLNIVSTFNLITTPAMMVQAGLGYAFTFDKLVNTSADSGLCFRPLEPKVDTGLYLVWQKYQVFTKAAKVFLEQVRETLLK